MDLLPDYYPKVYKNGVISLQSLVVSKNAMGGLRVRPTNLYLLKIKD